MIHSTYADLTELFDVDNSDTNVEFHGVVSDTRKDCDGALFIALKGDNFDGHHYVKAAFEKGAVVALVSELVPCDIKQILVADTLVAYGQIANFWRKKINPTVIAITGSNGKTTVKEMLASILSKAANTLATSGNLNNEIGVPQTLCELAADDQFAVIEMGANHAAEIQRLSAIAEPNLVYVNNASATHLEGFGSLQGVQKAKGELYRYAAKDAVAVINADDAAAQQWFDSCATQNRITISCADDQASLPIDIAALNSGDELHIKTENEQFSLHLKVKGQHNQSNALAAASLALALNIPVEIIVAQLNKFTGFKGRLEFVDGVFDSTIINDSYNANPTSFKAGINVLCELQGDAWLAMGDMGELGESAQIQHDDVVTYAKDSGVKALFSKGSMSSKAARLMQSQYYDFSDFAVMADAIKEKMKTNEKHVNVLVKGSRSAQMERLVAQLTRGVC